MHGSQTEKLPTGDTGRSKGESPEILSITMCVHFLFDVCVCWVLKQVEYSYSYGADVLLKIPCVSNVVAFCC